MLQVTDEGVKIALQPTVKPPAMVSQIVVSAVVIAVAAALMTLGLLPVAFGIALIVLAVLAGYVWLHRVAIVATIATKTSPAANHPHHHHQRHQHQLSGGNLLLTPYCLSHQYAGKLTEYRLQPTDQVQCSENTLTIYNEQQQPLYQITGFSEPRHCEIAKAVLSGSKIQAQGKAIRMASNT